MLSLQDDGAWHVPPHRVSTYGGQNTMKTWTGPVSTRVYGQGLTDLCDRTRDSINRLSQQMQKMDPCLEYGIKHWHPTSRPKSAASRIERASTPGRWENMDVMFTDSHTLDSKSTKDDDTESFMETPAPVNKFCYLCSTLEEHQKHMLHHKPKKRPASAKPRITYIAPRPRVKKKEDKEDSVLIKDRLYKLEVFTSNIENAGTTANIFVAIKGSADILPKTQLVKRRGCSRLCLMRDSKEVFHIKGPFLGNLEVLSVEHDGKDKKHAWHMERIEVTDVKAMKTWVFHCNEWLSIFHKPLYSNRVDLKAEEKERPPTDYSIEIYTGKQKMAGTDANIYITLFGQHGNSKKIHLVDPSSDKKLFEKNSVDQFRLRMYGLGELKRIRIEHDGKGFGAGWFFDKAIISSSHDPVHKYYFVYGGWIAKDEGDGKLWREIKAKKSLPKELKHGTDAKYVITTKTGDVRFAGTDADVFIQMVGEAGMTPKLKLDDAKNNFERKMTDNFELFAVNVGPIKHIVIGHDNSGPGAGWFLDTVTVRRYVPKEEALKRLRKMKQRLKGKKKLNRKVPQSSDEESDIDDKDRRREDDRKLKDKKIKKKHEDKKSDDKKGKGNFFTVSSESSDSSSSSDEESGRKKKDSRVQRPGSALRRKTDKEDRTGRRRTSSASSEDRGRRTSSASPFGRSLSERRVSTSASSQKRQEQSKKKKKGNVDDDDDDNLQELRVPLFEEYTFVCRRWLASDEDDGLCVRELPVEKKTTYYKE